MRAAGQRGFVAGRPADAGGTRAAARPSGTAASADRIVVDTTSEGRAVTPSVPLSRSAHAYPEHLRSKVEGYLGSLRFTTGRVGPEAAGLEEAMRYSLLAGGKRIRPVLALATASAIGRDPDSVLPFAAAIELIHTYSLIHDDLPAMDDDDLRRGRLSCHKVFGDDGAILAGDGLYAEAFSLLLSAPLGEPADVLAAAASLAAATGVAGMVGGQFMDVAGTAGSSPEGLRRLHELKTGRLIAASIECPLLLAGSHKPVTISA